MTLTDLDTIFERLYAHAAAVEQAARAAVERLNQAAGFAHSGGDPAPLAADFAGRLVPDMQAKLQALADAVAAAQAAVSQTAADVQALQQAA